MTTLTFLEILLDWTLLGMVITIYLQLRVVQKDINKLELSTRDLSKTLVEEPKKTQDVLIGTKWKFIDDNPFKQDLIYTIVDVKYNDADKLYIKYQYGHDCYGTDLYEKFERYYKQIN